MLVFIYRRLFREQGNTTLQFDTKVFGGILDASFNETLNRYGSNGWELVSCFEPISHTAPAIYSGRTQKQVRL